ncbi:hypothetical protein CHS0354_019351 [Potamilus streckersoni]|uniref:Uncharacterized protein n=1 Tax=Potamilus streckersoni TaxID=2493646 RepID=A0AAE0VVD8_9BIVA|nr:hypothetical protein CHS0354_019351 [Potamilus streckersoni]
MLTKRLVQRTLTGVLTGSICLCTKLHNCKGYEDPAIKFGGRFHSSKCKGGVHSGKCKGRSSREADLGQFCQKWNGAPVAPSQLDVKYIVLKTKINSKKHGNVDRRIQSLSKNFYTIGKEILGVEKIRFKPEAQDVIVTTRAKHDTTGASNIEKTVQGCYTLREDGDETVA